MRAAFITMTAALALAACGGANTANETATADNGAMASDPMATDMAMDNAMADNAAMTAPMTAQQFADAQAASDAYEIASSKLAADKAQAELKSFAQQMVKDHTDSTAKLKAAAGSITPNPAMTAEQQANIDALEAATGAAFDTAYRTQQLAAHQKALATLQGYAASGDNAELKTFASQTAPIVQGHLTMLQGM